MIQFELNGIDIANRNRYLTREKRKFAPGGKKYSSSPVRVKKIPQRGPDSKK